MLFTWDTKNLCIVFRQWHVRSTSGLIISLLLVVALAAGYEALRAASRRYENSVNKRVESLPSKPSPLLHDRKHANVTSKIPIHPRNPPPPFSLASMPGPLRALPSCF
ncbi:hypothetical protein LZ32DRAFT_597944 [Colletotrichum eremochloae]|nr:hypothetical protein LZ32DRAFT_597944 [Colletotrichum eremochloae]